MEKVIELRPIRETTEDYELVEKRIRDLFKAQIYLPLLEILRAPKTALKNSKDDLLDALRSGRVTFSRGAFTGKFTASISRELKKMGASWDKKESAWKIRLSSLSPDIHDSVLASETRFAEKLAKIDKRLGEILPEELAKKVKLTDVFDRTLWKTEKEFESTLKGIAIQPALSADRRKVIARDWQNNMEIYIKDFAEKQIKELRKEIKERAFTGDRYESSLTMIQKSYGVSARKAKFLARQETSLLMSKYKEVRYKDAGVHEYKWMRVSGTPEHPVRPKHKELAAASASGRVFRFDQPPNTAEEGTPARHNNPGEDYNCRCYAKPVVRVSSVKTR